jgi:hypothetical protein
LDEITDIVGSYFGLVADAKFKENGTEFEIKIRGDVRNTPGTAEWIREIVQNPAYVTVGRYDGLKDIGKRGPGRPPKLKEQGV